MKLVFNKDIKPDKWRALLQVAPQVSPFQTLDYYIFFDSLTDFSTDAIAVEENNQLKALCLVTLQKEKGVKGYFSRRAIIYGGPLVKPDETESLFFLLKKIREYYKSKVIYLEIRNYFDYAEYRNYFEQSGFKYLPWLNFHLSTVDADKMKTGMSSSRLRQIKKAIESGVEWREADSVEEIEVFYNILHDLYHTKIKKPLLPKAFFIEFFNRNLGKYLLIHYNNKIVGGIMCPIMPDKSIYEFYVCGLDNEYKEQFPSVMATWAAMQYANQNNIPMFDFMGAGSPDESYGVRDFKARFGGQEVEYGRFICILNPSLYSIGKMGLNVLSKF
jgi:serine/alanine adding enzyme